MMKPGMKWSGPLSLHLMVHEIDLEAGAEFTTKVMGAISEHAKADAVRAFLMGTAIAATSALAFIGAREDAETLLQHLASELGDVLSDRLH